MDTYQQDFIKNLKLERTKKNLSQAKFAELCNVSTGTIGNIECGLAKPSFDLLVKMADVLNISPSQLFSTHTSTIKNHSSEEKELLVKLNTMIEDYLSQ